MRLRRGWGTPFCGNSGFVKTCVGHPALTGKGYGVKGHIDLVHDFGAQTGDITSENKFVSTTQGVIRDTVGPEVYPPSGTFEDYAVKQWFTVKYRGHIYAPITEFGHQTLVKTLSNGTVSVTNKVWPIVP